LESVKVDTLYHIASQLGNLLQEKNARICTAESCTGGGIASALTAIPGSSKWFEYGWVTYSNQAKTELLGIPQKILDEEGAVSEAVVLAMAEGARKRSKASVSVSVSGIAGPGGGSVEKPVGTVWLGFSTENTSYAIQKHFNGDRRSIRQQTVQYALEECIRMLSH
jgi:nicotinamide-nucleotide amidase